MKKSISFILVFVFALQVSTPSSLAQSSSAATAQAIQQCYNQVFQNAQTSISVQANQKVEISEAAKMDFLHSISDFVSKFSGPNNGSKIGVLIIYFSFLFIDHVMADINKKHIQVTPTLLQKFHKQGKDFEKIADDLANSDTFDKVDHAQVYKIRQKAQKYLNAATREDIVELHKDTMRARQIKGAIWALALEGLLLYQDYLYNTQNSNNNDSPSSLEDLQNTSTTHEYYTFLTSEDESTQKMAKNILSVCEAAKKINFGVVHEVIKNAAKSEFQLSIEKN